MYTIDFGGGIQIFRKARQSWTIGYRYQHLSNANISHHNPGMDSNAFYNDGKGTNYAQSRYLCYYLQEKAVLVKFYQEFYAHRQEDPTGFKTLQKVLVQTDMDLFKKKWEKYVLGLGEEFELRPVRP